MLTERFSNLRPNWWHRLLVSLKASGLADNLLVVQVTLVEPPLSCSVSKLSFLRDWIHGLHGK